MSKLDAFIMRGHQKIIDHYRQLRDTAPSDTERKRFQRCMDQEEQTLRDFVERRSHLVQLEAVLQLQS
jgi:hypothetical protein